MGGAGLDGADGRLADVLRGAEIRLSDAEGEHIGHGSNDVEEAADAGRRDSVDASGHGPAAARGTAVARLQARLLGTGTGTTARSVHHPTIGAWRRSPRRRSLVPSAHDIKSAWPG